MESIRKSGDGCADHGGVDMKKEEYLHIVTDQIRCKKARTEVKTELEDGEAAMQRRSQIGSSCFISQVFC